MREPGRRSPVLALVGSTHPGPSLAVTLITVVLGASVGLEPWRLIALGAAMLCGQASVGLSNDWLDAARDRAAGRTDKPVAAGDIGVPLVRGAAFGLLALAVVLTLPLGALATIAHAVFLVAGWGYNLGVKNTTLSVLPYLVGFGVLPLVATLALPAPEGAAWWALGSGALLGAAAHFANALPDLEADRATGIVGLPHRMGERASGIATFLALATAGGLVIVGPGVAFGAAQWVAVGLIATIVVFGVTLALTRPPGRLLFQLVILAALVAVASLVFAGAHLAVG